jgi:hypothetical protein
MLGQRVWCARSAQHEEDEHSVSSKMGLNAFIRMMTPYGQSLLGKNTHMSKTTSPDQAKGALHFA